MRGGKGGGSCLEATSPSRSSGSSRRADRGGPTTFRVIDRMEGAPRGRRRRFAAVAAFGAMGLALVVAEVVLRCIADEDGNCTWRGRRLLPRNPPVETLRRLA